MRDKLENYYAFKRRRDSLFKEKDRIEKELIEYEPSLLGSAIGGTKGSGTSAPTESIAIEELSFKEEKTAELDAIKIEICELSKIILECEEFIKAITDEQLRNAFIWRFKYKWAWQTIADEWGLSAQSWYLVQKKVNNYLENNKSQ